MTQDKTIKLAFTLEQLKLFIEASNHPKCKGAAGEVFGRQGDRSDTHSKRPVARSSIPDLSI